MIKTLPIFYFRPMVVCIDDDISVIEVLRNLINKKFRTETFLNTNKFLDFIKGYASSLNDKSFLRNFEESEHGDSPYKSLVEFRLNDLHELFNSNDLSSEVGVVIIDYLMPGINGIELCNQLHEYKFKKIVLTGSDDYKLGHKARDEELIDRFINKTVDPDTLLTVIDELSFKYYEDITYSLKQHIETEHRLPLSDKLFINYFLKLMKDLKIKGYHLFDKGGSLCMIDEENKKYIMSIYTSESLEQLLRVIKEESGYNDIYELIKTRKKIPINHVFDEELDLEELKNNLVEPEVLIGKENYYFHLREFNKEAL